MAVFQSDARVVLKRLADKAYETSQERDQLLVQLAAAEGLKAKDVAWMLFRPDRAYRDGVVPVLKRLADPDTLSSARLARALAESGLDWTSFGAQTAARLRQGAMHALEYAGL